MAIYIVYYILIGISAVLLPRLPLKRVKSLQFILLGGGLFLILALRHISMGVDLGDSVNVGYIAMFKQVAKTGWQGVFSNSWMNYERGYVIFTKLLSYISTNPQCVLVGTAAVSIIPIMAVYRVYSVDFEFSIIVYMALTCFMLTFSGLRQACAIGICFATLPFIRKRKIIPFILMVLLAATFHRSAIIFLISYFAYPIRIRKTFRWMTLLLVGLVFIFRTPLFNLLSPILKENAEVDNNGAVTLLLVFVVLYIFCNLLGNDDKEHSGLMNLFLIGIFMQVFGNVYALAGRVAYYFMPFIGLLIPKTFRNIKQGKTKIIVTLIVALILVGYGLYCIYGSQNSFAEAYPYRFFWE